MIELGGIGLIALIGYMCYLNGKEAGYKQALREHRLEEDDD